MANNYTYFSLQVLLNNDEQATWLKTFLKYCDDASGDTVEVEHGPESRALLEVFPDWNDNEYLGFDWEVNGKEMEGLWIYVDDGEGNTSRVADLLQFFLGKFELKEAIGFEFCWTCGLPRPNEFGGGACVVTAETQEWKECTTWMEDKIKELGK